MRGRRCVPPSTSGAPKRRWAQPKRPVSSLIRRSAHSASSRPPPTHQPVIAAIVGFGEGRRVKPSSPSARSLRSRTASASLRSAPALNAASPAPVSTSTRAESSAVKRRKPASRVSAVPTSTALRACGRSIVRTAAAPIRSYRTGDMGPPKPTMTPDMIEHTRRAAQKDRGGHAGLSFTLVTKEGSEWEAQPTVARTGVREWLRTCGPAAARGCVAGARGVSASGSVGPPA